MQPGAGAPPPADRRAAGTPPRRGAGRAFEVVLSLYGAAIFTVLWVGLAVGVASGGKPLADAWAWLTGLEPAWSVIAWILLLPIAVALWAWNSFDSPLFLGVVAAGLVAWTLLMASGLARTFRRDRVA